MPNQGFVEQKAGNRKIQNAAALQTLAESYSQQDPTFESTIAYTRLTAAAAIKELQRQGFELEEILAPSTMADILNRILNKLEMKLIESRLERNPLLPKWDILIQPA